MKLQKFQVRRRLKTIATNLPAEFLSETNTQVAQLTKLNFETMIDGFDYMQTLE